MKIKSFGCSFIYGSELHNELRDDCWSEPSRFAWPALVAKKLNVEYQCFAVPGSGNLQIFEKILNHAVTENGNAFYIIGWTWIERFDYTVADSNPEWGDSWQTICPAAIDNNSRFYYKNIHSEFRDKLTSLTYIALAIRILKENNIPFLMTYQDPLMLDQQWNVSAGGKFLQNQISQCMTAFDGCTFLDWARQNNFPISELWHPLEEAHSAAADYMLDQVQAQVDKLTKNTL